VHVSELLNRSVCALAAIVVAGLLAACGSSSSSKTSTSSTSTSASTSGAAGFVSSANNICKSALAKVNAIPKPTSTAGLARYLNQAVPIASNETAQLAALAPPSNLQASYQQFLSLTKRQQALARGAQAAANRGDIARAAVLSQRVQPLSTRSNAVASSIGLTECAK
jgi:hypothetical protein